MRKLFIYLMLAGSITAHAQKDSSDVEFLVAPDSTVIGAPDGNAVSKEIGAAGGRVVSEDGRIELIFPEGALTASTLIRIQPTINHAPNGSGKSYWFEPSGIQFKKPVQVIFHYTEEEAESCPPDLMCWGIQNKTGKWTFIEYEEMDTVSRTLKGWIHHFSGGSNVYKLKLEPQKTKLCVGEKTRIEIWRHYPPVEEGIEMLKEHTSALNAPALWFVNKIESGNGSVGYVIPIQTRDKIKKQSMNSAEYLAPDFLVRKNPVTVSVDLYVWSGKKKVYNKARTISCKIDIYDVYEVSFTVKYDLFNNVEITDSAAFFAWVYPGNVIVDNIKNAIPFINKQVNKFDCKLVLYTEGYNGLVHLKDGLRISKVSADQPPKVSIGFVHEVQTVYFKFHWQCPKIKPIPPEILPGSSLSPEIDFVANGESQTMEWKMNLFYGTIKVRPYRRK